MLMSFNAAQKGLVLTILFGCEHFYASLLFMIIKISRRKRAKFENIIRWITSKLYNEEMAAHEISNTKSNILIGNVERELDIIIKLI